MNASSADSDIPESASLDSKSRPPQRSWRRTGLLTSCAVVAIVLAMELAVRVIVDDGFVQERIQATLPEPIRVHVSGVSVSLLAARVQADRLQFVTSGVEGDTDAATTSRITADGVRARGASPLAALLQGDFVATELRVASLRLDGNLSGWQKALAQGDAFSGTSLPSTLLVVDQIDVDCVAADDATWQGSGRDLHCAMLDDGQLVPTRAVVTSVRRRHVGEGSDWQLQDLTLDDAGSPQLHVEQITFDTFPDPDTLIQQGAPRRDDLHLRGEALDLDGLDLAALARGEGVRIDAVELAALDLTLLSDQRLAPPASSEPSSPGAALRALATPVRVDRIDVRSGRFVYEERHPSADRPGRIVFDELECSVARLRAGDVIEAKDALQVHAKARFCGEALTEVGVRFPLGDADSPVKVAGTVATLDATRLNEILVPLEGLRVDGGTLRSAAFDFQVFEGRSQGNVDLAYEGLEIVTVDRVSGEPSVLNRVESAVLDWVALENENVSPLRPGRVSYRRAPEDGYAGFVWKCLRSGLLDALGL